MTANSEQLARHDHLRIHIDQQSYHSPNPTTAEALYVLGNVKPGHILYREVQGDREDEAIHRGPMNVHLHEDEHFHSAVPNEVTIIVEGTPYEWPKPEITYDEVATLFDPNFPQHPELNYAVTYDRGPNHKPEGILPRGGRVKVKEGMVFNVSPTGKS